MRPQLLTNAAAISHGSRTRKPSSNASVAMPAASMRFRTSVTSGTTIVQCRSPTEGSGAGPTPTPFHTLKPSDSRLWRESLNLQDDRERDLPRVSHEEAVLE